ncbi:MAG: hypothetical protein IAE90_11125 [Ignavibacteria bacterium]|nr:hypothetical protein [Ignavibacteria bacterium]
MKNILMMFFLLAAITGSLLSQQSPVMKLGEKRNALKDFNVLQNTVEKQDPVLNRLEKPVQLKKRKTVTSYFGAGYSFMIFTNSFMSAAFPVLDTRNGSFLTNINLFFGFSIAKAITLEISPSILFTSNNKQVNYYFPNRYSTGSGSYLYGHTYTNGIIALPIAFNVRFFPLYKQKGFGRLFFVGGGIGAAWVREENDLYFNDNPNSIVVSGNQEYIPGLSTSQWTPLFRALTGFTGTGGQFGFGGEVSYNFLPLKQTSTEPFATRFAKDMNSVDLTLRFYFSL